MSFPPPRKRPEHAAPESAVKELVTFEKGGRRDLVEAG